MKTEIEQLTESANQLALQAETLRQHCPTVAAFAALNQQRFEILNRITLLQRLQEADLIDPEQLNTDGNSDN